MNIILKILFLLYPAAILLSPFFLYRKTYNWIMWFYRRMASDERCRESYVMALVAAVVFYNFIYYQLMGPSFWEFPGFIAGFVLLNNKFTFATLGWLHDDRMLQQLLFALILFSLIMPELFSFSVSLATVMLATLFYPSRKVMKVLAHPDDYPSFHGTNDEIYRLYY